MAADDRCGLSVVATVAVSPAARLVLGRTNTPEFGGKAARPGPGRPPGP